MTSRDFEEIRGLAYKITGIALTDHKKNMVYGRISRRLRLLKIASFHEYCLEIQRDGSPELNNFVNAITTNLTSFFRENHHFEHLKSTVIPNLLRSNASSKRIRVWSAGCSTGEEAYSIAMVLHQFSALRDWDVKILATDLDSNVVNTGRGAVYHQDRVEKIPSAYNKYFERAHDSEQVRVRDDISSKVTFKQLNLLHKWPMKGEFDVIFCRNVVIYFDVSTQKVLFDRYAGIMSADAHLFIGHSENLHKITDRFESRGRTIYQKVC